MPSASAVKAFLPCRLPNLRSWPHTVHVRIPPTPSTGRPRQHRFPHTSTTPTSHQHPLSPSPAPTSYREHRRHQSSTTTPNTSSTPNLPLHPLRVLDLSRVLAGPFCTQILADYGADVLKVEQPGSGDETRLWRAQGESASGFWRDAAPDPAILGKERGGGNAGQMSLYFASINRNKRSITLDLKTPEGVAVVRELVRGSDVLIHNFLPGKAEGLGLGWEEMRRVNGRLVYASVSGYGSTGPARGRAGYDAIALAESGLLHITGEKGRGPVKPGVAIADLCTGLYAHGAILAALRQRDITGEGCRVEGSLFETGLSLLINVGLASLNLDKKGDKRRRGGRFGLGHAALVPYGGFSTGDGRMLFIAANNNRQWKRLCEVMGVEVLLAEQRFGSNDGRVENREEIDGLLQKRFNEKSLTEWLEVFDGTGLPYGPINDVVEALEGEQSLARGMVMDIEDFEAAKDGMLRTIGPAVKFEGTSMDVRRPPPQLGEHTDEVLSELGYDKIRINEMRRAGII